MVCAPVRSIIPLLKLGDYLSVQAHKPCSISHISITCKVYPGYHGTSEIEHGLCACTVNNPLAKAWGLSLRTGAQTMLYLSLVYRASETKEEGVYRRRGGKTLLQSGQGWTLPAQLEQLKTGLDGKVVVSMTLQG